MMPRGHECIAKLSDSCVAAVLYHAAALRALLEEPY